MYTLTLTHDERKAIDWIGHRYAHGDYLRRMLDDSSVVRYNVPFNITEEDIFWDIEHEITFNIPEHIAWEIRDIVYSNGCSLECFSDELKAKLIHFSEQII